MRALMIAVLACVSLLIAAAPPAFANQPLAYEAQTTPVYHQGPNHMRFAVFCWPIESLPFPIFAYPSIEITERAVPVTKEGQTPYGSPYTSVGQTSVKQAR